MGRFGRRGHRVERDMVSLFKGALPGFDVVADLSLAEMLLLSAAGKWSSRYVSSGRRASVVVVGAVGSVLLCAVVVGNFAPFRGHRHLVAVLVMFFSGSICHSNFAASFA